MGDPKRATVTLDFEKPLVELEEKILSLQQSAAESDVDVSDEVARLRKQVEKRSKEIFGSLSNIEFRHRRIRPLFLLFVLFHNRPPQRSELLREQNARSSILETIQHR